MNSDKTPLTLNGIAIIGAIATVLLLYVNAERDIISILYCHTYGFFHGLYPELFITY